MNGNGNSKLKTQNSKFKIQKTNKSQIRKPNIQSCFKSLKFVFSHGDACGRCILFGNGGFMVRL